MKQSLVESSYKGSVSVKEDLNKEAHHLKITPNISKVTVVMPDDTNPDFVKSNGNQSQKTKDLILQNLQTSEKSTAVDLSMITRSSLDSLKLKQLVPSKPDVSSLEVPEFLNYFHIHFNSVPCSRPVDPFTGKFADRITIFDLDTEANRCVGVSSPFKLRMRSQSDEAIENEINYSHTNLNEGRVELKKANIREFSGSSSESMQADHKNLINNFQKTKDPKKNQPKQNDRIQHSSKKTQGKNESKIIP